MLHYASQLQKEGMHRGRQARYGLCLIMHRMSAPAAEALAALGKESLGYCRAFPTIRHAPLLLRSC